MIAQNIEPIMVKIKKLLTLAQNEAATQDEAQHAMMKAQEMLAKYKLSMRDVQNSHLDEGKVTKKYTDVTFKKATWKGRLASIIADNFSCYNYYSTNGTQRVVFMGLEEDAETATSVFEYAVEFITGRVRQLRTKYYRLGESTRGLENDYAQGFIFGLSEKFRQQKEENQEWALVLVKPQMVVQAYKSMKWSRHPVNVRAKFNGYDSAWNQGKCDGQNFVMISGHIGG